LKIQYYPNNRIHLKVFEFPQNIAVPQNIPSSKHYNGIMGFGWSCILKNYMYLTTSTIQLDDNSFIGNKLICISPSQEKYYKTHTRELKNRKFHHSRHKFHHSTSNRKLRFNHVVIILPYKRTFEINKQT